MACLLPTPYCQLDWKEVVEYVFPADFNLLRDARQDISNHLWATPAGRLAMDLYFKIAQAHKEITRLNIEIRHIATYICDEDPFLQYLETKALQTNAWLSLQIKLRHEEQGHFHNHHRCWLRDIARLDNFSRNILPGMSLARGMGESASVWALLDVAVTVVGDADEDDEIPANQQEADEEAEADIAMEELIQDMASIMQASLDWL
jgi:hypothetical protein